MYRLLLHPDVEKQLGKFPRPYAARLVEAMRSLRSEPRPSQAKQLARHVYRLRLGDYRIIYAVLEAEEVIFIGKVARRSEKTYRDAGSLLARARKLLEDKE